VNVSFQFNIQPGLSTTNISAHNDQQINQENNNVDDAQLQSLMASTLGLLSNLQNYQKFEQTKPGSQDITKSPNN
jgi:hypothetical protein